MDITDWIEVGKLSAERDDNLSNYFYDNGVLNKVIKSPSSFLVLGRKGAGKTAIFRYLTKNPSHFLDENDILVSLSFDDYNWSIHELLKNPHTAESLSYRQSWRFVILVEVIKAYCKSLEQKQERIPSELKKANKVLSKLFDSPFPSLSQLIGHKLLSIGKLTLPKAGLGLDDAEIDNFSIEGGEVSFDAVQNDPSLKEKLCSNVDFLITYFDSVIHTISPMSAKVFICFDRIDEAWDNISVDVSRKVIAGLVSAADAMTPKYNGYIRPLVFLREDIFEVLSLNDLNKLREDCGALLNWDKESLTKLLMKRINYFAEKNGQAQLNDIDALFDKNEMRQRAKPSNYILKRTMMRPRDVISLFGKTINSMKDAKNDPFNEEIVSHEKIGAEFVYQAEPQYSSWLKQEIIDEWSVQRPEIVVLLDAIQNHSSTNFTKEEMLEEIKKIDKNYIDEKITEHLRFLFDVSIIGFKIGQSNAWKYKCFTPSQGFIDSDEYKVHDGLNRVLNLKEPREKNEQ